MFMIKPIAGMLILAATVLFIPAPVLASEGGGAISNMPIPWYWLMFAGAMISTTGILIYRKNTKVYKD